MKAPLTALFTVSLHCIRFLLVPLPSRVAACSPELESMQEACSQANFPCSQANFRGMGWPTISLMCVKKVVF